jgi:hypothetical protein
MQKSCSKSRRKVTNLEDRTSATVLAESWIELGTERESLLEVLNENANFGGQPATGRPYGKDRYCSVKGSQKTNDRTFSEFCGKKPCRPKAKEQYRQVPCVAQKRMIHRSRMSSRQPADSTTVAGSLSVFGQPFPFRDRAKQSRQDFLTPTGELQARWINL